MKRISLLLLILFVAVTINAQQKTDWANFSRYEEADKTAPHGAIVFMGNSITQGWASSRPDFFKSNNYVGRGIGGQVSSQMLVRFRRDVIDLKPRAVVILAGTNDIAQNNGPITLENVLGNIISMCELAKANNIKVVLCSVLPAYQFGWRKELAPANDVITLNKMIKQYADANKIPYVDYHSALKDEQNGLPEKYAKDGIHPTPEGYEIMEKLVKPVIDKLGKAKAKDRQYLFGK